MERYTDAGTRELLSGELPRIFLATECRRGPYKATVRSVRGRNEPWFTLWGLIQRPTSAVRHIESEEKRRTLYGKIKPRYGSVYHGTRVGLDSL